MVSLTNIGRIGAINAQKLGWAGVESTDALLERGASRRDRLMLAGETGLSSKRLLEWVNHIDLYRINGIGEDYAKLLEAVGIDSLEKLALQEPELLAEKIEIINQQEDLVQRQPSLKVVTRWVKEARKLPKLVEPE
mgnify:FL=1